MSKESKVKLELDIRSALELLQILDSSVANYSIEHAPERIVRLREVIDDLDKALENSIQS